MHISLTGTTVKNSYSKHAYNKFTEVSFILLILKLYNKHISICHKLLLFLQYHSSLALCNDQVLLYKIHMPWLLGRGLDSHHLGGTWWCGGNTATDPSPPWCPASGTSSGSLTASGYWRCPRPNPWCSDWKKFWNLKGIELDIGNSIGLKSTLKSTMYHNICKISTKHSNH